MRYGILSGDFSPFFFAFIGAEVGFFFFYFVKWADQSNETSHAAYRTGRLIPSF